jgi:hypothetical protein
MARSSDGGSGRARERAERHFVEALEHASTLDQAWRVVLSGPKMPALGAERYVRLGEFLKHLAPSPGTSEREREAYVAMLERFLRTEALERPVAVRAIVALRGQGKSP